MIEDVYEPLKEYCDSLREKFAELTRQKFRDLLAKSGVDVEANRKLVAEINDLTTKSSGKSAKHTLLLIICIISLTGAAVCGVLAYNANLQLNELTGLIIACIAFLILTVASAIKCVKLYKLIKTLEDVISRKTEEAREQMRPLNDLYTWDIPIALIEKTVPRLAFDPYFTIERLEDLKRLFGWDDSFNDGKSILFAQSGTINGNPFVFGEFLEMNWETKTYTGYKTISWIDSVIGIDGKRYLIPKMQTLSASVTKPCPAYSKDKLLIYGNDAAPHLNFSRTPSDLSNAEEGFITDFRKRQVLKDLQEYSENLDDDSNYTLMANHEFETLFNARNRDNEVEFRLLFTSLAQEQILKLMKDDRIGYGDDFTFIKREKINLLRSRHLSDFSLSTDPKIFHDWNFARAHLNFLNINENYFKNLYFSLAPLLSIPLYQQTRTREDIYKNAISEQSSFWEHEAIANYYGNEYFQHQDCVTENILKTEFVSRQGGIAKIRVIANGFGSRERIDYQMVWGGDGELHKVPIKWTEYFPVKKESYIYLSENPKYPPCNKPPNSIFRRNIYAYI